jgi:hypothetical protein
VHDLLGHPYPERIEAFREQPNARAASGKSTSSASASQIERRMVSPSHASTALQSAAATTALRARAARATTPLSCGDGVDGVVVRCTAFVVVGQVCAGLVTIDHSAASSTSG